MIKWHKWVLSFFLFVLLAMPAGLTIFLILNKNSVPISIDPTKWSRPVRTISGQDRYFLNPSQLADRIERAKKYRDAEAAYDVWAYFKTFKETSSTKAKIDSWAAYAAELGSSEAQLYFELEGIERSEVSADADALASDFPDAPK